MEVRPARDSVADRNIAAIAGKGWYHSKSHVDELRRQGRDPDRAKEIVEGHVRRLEALRRVGTVNRVADGVWEVPFDLVDQGKAYDRSRLNGIELELHSHLSIESQVRTIGATWLDRQLTNGEASNLATGFGAATRQAMRDRVDFLVEQGLAEKREGRALVSGNLVETLRARELSSVAKQLERESGLTYRPVMDNVTVKGTYRRSITLASGRFAMLTDGLGFVLVPWRPAIESQLGRSVSARVRGDTVSWALGRQRGRSL